MATPPPVPPAGHGSGGRILGRTPTEFWTIVGSLAGVLGVLVTLIFGISQCGSPNPPGPAPSATTTAGTAAPPGRYSKNEVIFQAAGWLVTLTAIEVRADRTVRTELTYRNQGSTQTPSCAGYTDPGIDTLTLAGATPVPATRTFCSDRPDWQQRLPSGATTLVYADFPIVPPANQPFTLTWQSGMPITGTAYNLRIP